MSQTIAGGCDTLRSGTLAPQNPLRVPYTDQVNQTTDTFIMSDTLTVNYDKNLYSTKTVEKIEELLEDSYALDDMLTFMEEHTEDDFRKYYEEYCTAGENIGYDVVDAFVKYHGMSYVEYVEDAFQGIYRDEASFAEEYYENVYGEVPTMLVVDWEATWKSSLSYDYDFVDGYVFSSNF